MTFLQTLVRREGKEAFLESIAKAHIAHICEVSKVTLGLF